MTKKVMIIFPHPDDEVVMVGGLMKRMRAYGYLVEILSVTAGERGRVFVNGKGRSVREIRVAEFYTALELMGGFGGEVWDFPDGRLKEVYYQQQLKRRLWQRFTEEKPDIIVTYDATGMTGHPDHIAVSKVIFEIFQEGKGDWELWWVKKEGGAILSLSWYELFCKLRAVMAYKSQALLRDKLVRNILRSRYECLERVHKNTLYRFTYLPYRID